MPTLLCPRCSRQLNVPDTLSGKKVRCPACSCVQTVPPAPESMTLPPAPSLPAGPGATTAPLPATAAGPPGDRAPDGYAIEKELGRGGMGVVYLAHDVRLQRRCALKVILSGAHSSDAEVARLRTEAQALARLQHPGIVQVFEIGEHDGKPFIALEFCGGGALDAKLARGPLPPRQAAVLVKALAEAVHAAHRAQVIHRDLKPANILLTEDGAPKVTDFGLAKKLDEQGATRTGSVMGTPSYMPPEQAQGKKDVGPAADVYSLGAILYECLASRPPFRAATAWDTIVQVLTHDPVPVRQFNPLVPVDLDTICLKCLHKASDRRYATAQELADDLGRHLKGEPIVARPVGLVERSAKWVRRNKAVSALAACVLLALTAGVVVSGLYAREAGQERQKATSEARAARLAEGNERLAKTKAEAANESAQQQLRRAEWLVYAGSLTQAQSAFQEGNWSLALHHLQGCQWDLRGWEHHHLWSRLHGHRLTLRGPSDITSCCFSPDGKYVLGGGAAPGAPGEARVWDAHTGQDVLTLKGHTGGVLSVCFSPDGKCILSGSFDGTARVWDARTGKELAILKGHTSWVTSVCFSPDGTRALTGSSDNTARLWDSQTWQEILSLKGHTSLVNSCCFSPDGQRIVTGSHDWTAKVWDAQTGQVLFTCKGHTLPVHATRFSPDGRRILTGSYDKTARVWDAEKGQELLKLTGHTASVVSVAFSPDGGRILTAGSNDGTARLWDAETGQELFPLRGHSGLVRCGDFSPDGRRILTGGTDGTVRVWDAGKSQDPLTLTGHRGFVSGACFSPDGQRLLTGSFVRAAHVWDASSGQELFALEGHPGPVHAVAFSPDGKRILTGCQDGTVRAWEAQKGEQLFSLKGHTSGVLSVCFSLDGKRILTGSEDRTARVWDADEGKQLFTLKGHTAPVSSVCFSPEQELMGKRLVTGGRDGTVRLWEGDRGQEVFALKGHGGLVSSAVFSPDGTRLLIASSDRTPRVWDVEKRQSVFTLKGHTAPVSGVCFSPDGLLLLSGSQDETAKVWDAVKGHELFTLRHTAPVTGVAFSPDGNRAFAQDATGKVLAWSSIDGKPHEPHDPPLFEGGPARSPDGFRKAVPRAADVEVTDSRLADPTASRWPLPDLSERKRYHSEQAALAEKKKQWFAVGFHLGQLLLDDPDNAGLKKRRADALARAAGK